MTARQETYNTPDSDKMKGEKRINLRDPATKEIKYIPLNGNEDGLALQVKFSKSSESGKSKMIRAQRDWA